MWLRVTDSDSIGDFKYSESRVNLSAMADKNGFYPELSLPHLKEELNSRVQARRARRRASWVPPCKSLWLPHVTLLP